MAIEVSELTIVIPTYERGPVLVQTLRRLLELPVAPALILVMDQTPAYPDKEAAALRELEAGGRVRRIRLAAPSIPVAMNKGLQEAPGRAVLFLDDDIEPGSALIAKHAAQLGGAYAAVCGQVLQPGQTGGVVGSRPCCRVGLRADLDFPFHGNVAGEVFNVMAGNLSVDRRVALDIGGFDERFIGSAYRFETDFARRLVAAGHRLFFDPAASLRHLRWAEGGTRLAGDHLARPSPLHACGDYYFAYCHGRGLERMGYGIRRLRQEVLNGWHLRRPWRLPGRLVVELRAWALGRRLYQERKSVEGRNG